MLALHAPSEVLSSCCGNSPVLATRDRNSTLQKRQRSSLPWSVRYPFDPRQKLSLPSPAPVTPTPRSIFYQLYYLLRMLTLPKESTKFESGQKDQWDLAGMPGSAGCLYCSTKERKSCQYSELANLERCRSVKIFQNVTHVNCQNRLAICNPSIQETPR